MICESKTTLFFFCPPTYLLHTKLSSSNSGWSTKKLWSYKKPMLSIIIMHKCKGLLMSTNSRNSNLKTYRWAIRLWQTYIKCLKAYCSAWWLEGCPWVLSKLGNRGWHQLRVCCGGFLPRICRSRLPSHTW